MFIEAFKGKYTVKGMCKCLFFSESGYYRWLKNKSKPSSRQLLSVEIQKIIDEHPDNDNYGVLRMRIVFCVTECAVTATAILNGLKKLKRI